MYRSLTHFVLGFHGCDQKLAEQVIGPDQSVLEKSENKYDWLGNGIYFWENDPKRALKYAEDIKNSRQKSQGSIQNPAVIGAIIDLGYCLNLVEAESLQTVKSGYHLLKKSMTEAGSPLPTNKPIQKETDLLIRELDCAVIETVHRLFEDDLRKSFDTVRGVFWEGEKLYPNAGFAEKNHIQVCVRNPNMIKGFFYPR